MGLCCELSNYETNIQMDSTTLITFAYVTWKMAKFSRLHFQMLRQVTSSNGTSNELQRSWKRVFVKHLHRTGCTNSVKISNTRLWQNAECYTKFHYEAMQTTRAFYHTYTNIHKGYMQQEQMEHANKINGYKVCSNKTFEFRKA